MERKIKFSHEYNKMQDEHRPTPRKAILMEVFVVDTGDLHPRFVEYDTIYFDEKINNWANYKLPKGKALVLLLRSYGDFIWTTIRRFTPKKYAYYKKNRWEEFEIIIEE